MVDGDKQSKKTLEQRKAELQKQLAIINQKLSQKDEKRIRGEKFLSVRFILSSSKNHLRKKRNS